MKVTLETFLGKSDLWNSNVSRWLWHKRVQENDLCTETPRRGSLPLKCCQNNWKESLWGRGIKCFFFLDDLRTSPALKWPRRQLGGRSCFSICDAKTNKQKKLKWVLKHGTWRCSSTAPGAEATFAVFLAPVSAKLADCCCRSGYSTSSSGASVQQGATAGCSSGVSYLFSPRVHWRRPSGLTARNGGRYFHGVSEDRGLKLRRFALPRFSSWLASLNKKVITGNM